MKIEYAISTIEAPIQYKKKYASTIQPSPDDTFNIRWVKYEVLDDDITKKTKKAQ